MTTICADVDLLKHHTYSKAIPVRRRTNPKAGSREYPDLFSLPGKSTDRGSKAAHDEVAWPLKLRDQVKNCADQQFRLYKGREGVWSVAQAKEIRHHAQERWVAQRVLREWYLCLYSSHC